MLLVDTSAWIEFLRDPGSDVCRRVDRELARGVALCDPIRMEVLAGARDEAHLVLLRRLLARATVVPTRPAHYDEAAALYRTCRQSGETPRRLVDCLIAAAAIDAGLAILHADADFEVLGRHTTLRLA